MYKIEKAINLLEKKGLGAIYLTKESNVNYMSRYTDGADFALISKNMKNITIVVLGME